MESQIKEITYTKFENVPPLEMQMPAKIRERLTKKSDPVRIKTDVKSQDSRMENALDNASMALINKIQKAQQHNQKIRQTRESYIARKAMDQSVSVEPEYFDEPQSQVNESEMLKTLAMQEAKQLNFERRQEKAQLRRDQQIANRIQNAYESQQKHWKHPTVRAQEKKQLQEEKIASKMVRAEAKRIQIQEEKRQKAKDAQEKYLVKEVAEKRRLQRSQSQALIRDKDDSLETYAILHGLVQGEEGPTKMQDVIEEQIAIERQLMKEAKHNQGAAKQSRSEQNRKKPVAFTLHFDKSHDDQNQLVTTYIKPKPRPQKDIKEVEQIIKPKEQEELQQIVENDKKENFNVQMPLNVDLQVQKSAVQEKQTMEINEKRTMQVGGNKLTFNIAITVQVEPIDKNE